MSRTRKGSKAPGWEPWSNRNDRQKPAPDYEREYMFITPQEVLMGRDQQYPLTQDLKENLDKLLIAVNAFRAFYGKPLIVSSGYRPAEFNTAAGGKPKSNHMICLAVDFHDPDGTIDDFCIQHPDILEHCGLYQEDPSSTAGWCHLQAVSPKSGKRVFLP